MTCQACGCKEEIMIHGHYQCAACGRMNYECCQGETEVAKEKNIVFTLIAFWAGDKWTTIHYI